MRHRDVQPGQRSKSDTGFVWEVQRVTLLDKAPKHVVIVNVNDPTSSKIISEAVLFETNRYEPAQ